MCLTLKHIDCYGKNKSCYLLSDPYTVGYIHIRRSQIEKISLSFLKEIQRQNSILGQGPTRLALLTMNINQEINYT